MDQMEQDQKIYFIQYTKLEFSGSVILEGSTISIKFTNFYYT
jgi:hypothetical protein